MLGRSVVVSLVACLAACSSSSGSDSGETAGAGPSSGGSQGWAGSSGAGAPSSSAGSTSFAGAGGGFASGGAFSSGGGFNSAGASSGGASGSGGAAGGSTGSGGMSGDAGAGHAGAGGTSNAKQSWIWVWEKYSTMLAANGPVFSKPQAFTHVSPALYNLNNNKSYSSGPADLNSSDFDGMSAKQVADTIHAAGLKVIPLMYAGAGNYGVDTGIQNILNDSTTQKNFIDAMVQEAVTNEYDGYNLDWEVQGTNYNPYGPKLVTFLTAFTAALHQHNMSSSFDTAGWYTYECSSGGLVKLSDIGNSVDQMIMEDYNGDFLDSPNQLGTACAHVTSADCDKDFVGELNTMCNLPAGVGNIGMLAPYGNQASTNKFLDKALTAVQAYGFRGVSLWPDNGTITDTGVPTKSDDPSVNTWRTWLAWWLTQP